VSTGFRSLSAAGETICWLADLARQPRSNADVAAKLIRNDAIQREAFCGGSNLAGSVAFRVSLMREM
jgi:hypothetical protein